MNWKFYFFWDGCLGLFFDEYQGGCGLLWILPGYFNKFDFLLVQDTDSLLNYFTGLLKKGTLPTYCG